MPPSRSRTDYCECSTRAKWPECWLTRSATFGITICGSWESPTPYRESLATLSQIGQLMLFLAIPSLLATGGYTFLIAALVLAGSPLISNLLQLALSRSREFNADLGAVRLTGDAKGLASALAKLERITSGTGFPWIVPGREKSQTVPATLRTHPPTDERIRRILAAGHSMGDIEPFQSSQRGQQRRLTPTDHERVRRGPNWHVAGLWY